MYHIYVVIDGTFVTSLNICHKEIYKVKILPVIGHSTYFSSRISALNVVQHKDMQFLLATHSLSCDLRSALAVSSNRQSDITWKEPD